MKKIIFAGTTEVAVQILQQLYTQVQVLAVITREDAPQGRKRVMTPSPVAALASELGIKAIKTNRPNADTAREISSLNPDLGIVVSYGALLKKDMLDVLDWYNVHFSLLPKLRGAAPVQHSLIQGMAETGVTVFKLDEGMDTGDIFAKREFPIADNDTTLSLLPKLAKASMPLLIDLVHSENPMLSPQQGEPSQAPKITREMAKVDFSKTAVEVSNLVRGCYPEPVAWAELEGQPIKIISAVPAGESIAAEGQLAPGRLLRRAGGVFIFCGEQSLLSVTRIQPAGKKEMDALDWINGVQGEVKFD